MAEVLRRELVYLWYYFSVQVEQIVPYWTAGILLGCFVSVFGKARIRRLFLIPVTASCSAKGMRDNYLATLMMSSILLNPSFSSTVRPSVCQCTCAAGTIPLLVEWLDNV